MSELLTQNPAGVIHREGRYQNEKWLRGEGSPIPFFIQIIFLHICESQLLLSPVSSFSCFNEYQKFANGFALNNCLYHLAPWNRRSWCNRKQTKSQNFYKEVAHFVSECGTPLSNFAEHLSVFLHKTSQYFCRTSFSNFAEHLLMFL